jgi:hypothetical protein
MIPLFKVDPSAVRRHVEFPHERPHFKDATDRKSYFDELWNSSKELENLLVNAGFSSSRATTIDGDFDFYMNDDLGEFRMLSFEIKNPKMASKEVLIKVSEWLQTREPDYSVFVTNEYEDSLELFLIIITRDTVFGELEERSTATNLGFDADSEWIGPIS